MRLISWALALACLCATVRAVEIEAPKEVEIGNLVVCNVPNQGQGYAWFVLGPDGFVPFVAVDGSAGSKIAWTGLTGKYSVMVTVVKPGDTVTVDQGFTQVIVTGVPTPEPVPPSPNPTPPPAPPTPPTPVPDPGPKPTPVPPPVTPDLAAKARVAVSTLVDKSKASVVADIYLEVASDAEADAKITPEQMISQVRAKVGQAFTVQDLGVWKGFWPAIAKALEEERIPVEERKRWIAAFQAIGNAMK